MSYLGCVSVLVDSGRRFSRFHCIRADTMSYRSATSSIMLQHIGYWASPRSVLVNLWYNVYNVAGVPIYMFYAFCSSDWVNITQISGNMAQACTSRKDSRVLASISGGARGCSRVLGEQCRALERGGVVSAGSDYSRVSRAIS